MPAKLSGLLLQTLLKQPRLRRRLSFELQQNYFADLETAVPLGCNLSCPIYYWTCWNSFTEIFLQQEYAAAFNKIPLPERFLDIGCHAGYFSLYVLWSKLKQNSASSCSAFLVDADPRMEPAVQRLIKLNNLQGKLSYLHGAISVHSDAQTFYQRQHMDSSLQKDNHSRTADQAECRVPKIEPNEILKRFAPPYDLIKLDIEGAEYDFLTTYQDVYKQSKFLLLEWHSWQQGGSGLKQLQELLAHAGFQLLSEVLPEHNVSFQGRLEQCGVVLYQNTNLLA